MRFIGITSTDTRGITSTDTRGITSTDTRGITSTKINRSCFISNCKYFTLCI